MKPWERYGAQQQPQAGPWTRYGSPQAPNATVEAQPAPLVEEPPVAAPEQAGAVESLGAGVVRGARDPVDSGAYLLPKALSFATSGYGLFPENPVAKFFGSEASRVSDLNKQAEQEFQQSYGNGWGTGGRIVGNVATAFLPGTGQTQAANAAQQAWRAGGALNKLRSMAMAGGLGAGQATMLGTKTEDDSAIVNAMLGAAGGMAGQGIVGGISDLVGGRVAASQSPGNVLRDQAARAAHEAGYVIPPSQTNPTLTNRILEGTAGKISTAQRASRANEAVTNDLVAKALGTTPENLTPEGLAAIRDQAGGAYKALGSVGTFTPDEQFIAQVNALRSPNMAVESVAPGMGNSAIDDLVTSLTSVEGPRDAEGMVEVLKRLRADARGNMANTLVPEKVGLGRAQKGAAQALESAIDRDLAATGRSDLLEAFQNARSLIAKTYNVEKSLGATGTVSAPKLADVMRKGAPLTGELRTVAEVGRAFPKAVQSLNNQSVPPISPLDWTLGGGLGGIGMLSGNPGLATLAAIRPAVRATILSKPYQQIMGQPSYGTSMLLRALGAEAGGAPLLPLTAAPLLMGAAQ